MINLGNKMLATMSLSTVVLFANAAQAMEIRQFDKMAVPDQGDYVGLLIAGAERVLNDEGRADLAAKVEHLFTTTEPGDKFTLGMVEFERNLALAREEDAKNVLKKPNSPRIEVEDAMAVTLKKNGIELPDSVFTAGKTFKQKLPSTSAPTPALNRSTAWATHPLSIGAS
jgi:hypothetical protein